MERRSFLQSIVAAILAPAPVRQIAATQWSDSEVAAAWRQYASETWPRAKRIFDEFRLAHSPVYLDVQLIDASDADYYRGITEALADAAP